jgi:hypothetical protein
MSAISSSSSTYQDPTTYWSGVDNKIENDAVQQEGDIEQKTLGDEKEQEKEIEQYDLDV